LLQERISKASFFALAAQKIWASYFMPAWSQTDLE